ncbi:MAG: hypothetical protein AMS18_11495 [Gemmatimonas sp. SG8_17]|nr:MAG: hypothetical protein AMS18_11495 [Gemmatimonas sp. SG8_17]
MTNQSVSGASPDTRRAPYLVAVAVFVTVLAGYVWTLAPTVTFWDAGEFIATAKILGIPHPPGTPLFTMLANVWARLVPLGEFAYRTNLMTAVYSASAAAFFFLLVAQAMRGTAEDHAGRDRIFTLGGGIAAALTSAFSFTVWQNSNETEVYMVAALSIAATAWLAWLWRRHRGEPRGPHMLLLIVYFAAVSIGNHLLALLVGPALIGFMAHVLKNHPLQNESDRKVEWGQWGVLTGAWAVLIGVGLGSTNLLVLGGIAFAAAAFYSAAVGGGRFAVTVLLIAVVGATTYLFLYFRANVGPFINEADPSTWSSLWDVIARKQYPPRSPWDNPIYPSGPGNPGRSIYLMALQAQNYLQYFDWQWAKGLAPTQPVFAGARLPFTLLFTSLGIYGAAVLWERDRSVFWFLVLLFVTTGPALMGYMNFKPGSSLGWSRFPELDMHEVRERDYFFTVSFQVWGMFAGIGLAGIYRELRGRMRRGGETGGRLVAAPALVLGVGLLPFLLNFNAASRRHGPEATLARDFAYDVLQSAEPYGIIFTNGDNDTFPLWYLQETEGIRRDVAVVNLSLGNTDWYLRQLRDNPVRPFEPEQAPWFVPFAPETPPPGLHSMTDEQILNLQPQLLSSELRFTAGRIDKEYPAGTPLYVKDILMLRLIQENWDRRPIYFSLTVGGGNWLQLDDYFTQEALVLRLHAAGEPDTSRLAPGIMNLPVDMPRTDSLAWQVYRYGRLFEADTLDMIPTNRNIATNLSYPFYALGQGYTITGDTERAVENFRRGIHLAPIFPQLAPALTAPEPVIPDSADSSSVN